MKWNKIHWIYAFACPTFSLTLFSLFSPSMYTVLIGGIQSHFFFGTSCLSLEEYRFTMVTFQAGVVISTWQGWIRSGTICVSSLQEGNAKLRIGICFASKYCLTISFEYLLNFVHNFIDINAIRIGLLFILANSGKHTKGFCSLCPLLDTSCC